MKYNSVSGSYFFGTKISEYGLKHNRVDYGTLAEAFDAVLNNDIIPNTANIGYWEMENGWVDNSDEIDELKLKFDEIDEKIVDIIATKDDYESDPEYVRLLAEEKEIENQIDELESEEENFPEIFQYYIISYYGADILKDWTNEIVYYNEQLDMYVWGVTHLGTAWDYVLTDIRCNQKEDLQ